MKKKPSGEEPIRKGIADLASRNQADFSYDEVVPRPAVDAGQRARELIKRFIEAVDSAEYVVAGSTTAYEELDQLLMAVTNSLRWVLEEEGVSADRALGLTRPRGQPPKGERNFLLAREIRLRILSGERYEHVISKVADREHLEKSGVKKFYGEQKSRVEEALAPFLNSGLTPAEVADGLRALLNEVVAERR